MFINLHLTPISMNADVLQELAAQQQQHGKEEGLLSYLNNFRFHLPGGWSRELTLGCWDVPYSQLGSTAHFSPKKQQQTPAQFYNFVDHALIAEGIVIPSHLQPFVGAKDPFFKGIRQDMFALLTLVLPGYAHLRDDGYTYIDLKA